MQSVEIQGDWMDGDGMLTGDRGRLLVYVMDGVAFDAEAYDHARGLGDTDAALLRVDRDGALRGWPAARFAPDAGELDRAGITAA